MPRDFASMAAFAVFVGGLVVKEIEAEHRALERSAKLVQRTAKTKIGTEADGWAPLAASTIDDKERKGYAVPAPLLRRGDMRDSIGVTVEAREAQVGSNSQIAVWQELGTSKMPPRSFLASSAIDKEKEIVELVGSGVAITLAGGGSAVSDAARNLRGTSEE